MEKLGIEPKKVMCEITVLPNYTISPVISYIDVYRYSK